MKCILVKAAAMLILSLNYFQLFSQLNRPRFQLGLSAGSFVYQGDLAPGDAGSYKTLKPVVQLFASKLMSPAFALRANLAFGSLLGDESKYDKPDYRQQRNFYFDSRVFEISIMGEWNILQRNYRTRGFAPYLVAGVGYGFLSINRDWSRFNDAYFPTESGIPDGLNEDINHSVPDALLVFPVGAGLRYYFSDKLGVSAESVYRVTKTDYLDGFSQAANPAKGDHYYSHTVGVVYRIGKKNPLDCPVIRY